MRFAGITRRDLTIGWLYGIQRLLMMSVGFWTSGMVRKFEVRSLPSPVARILTLCSLAEQIVQRAQQYDNDVNDTDNQVCSSIDCEWLIYWRIAATNCNDAHGKIALADLDAAAWRSASWTAIATFWLTTP